MGVGSPSKQIGMMALMLDLAGTGSWCVYSLAITK
jgi:hypothetical protein